MLKNYFHNGSNTWPDFHNNISYFIRKLIYNLFPYSIVMSPKMHNKHAFSLGVLYSGHELNYVMFHNRKSYLDLKTHNIFLRSCFMTNNPKITITKYNHISIRMYIFSLN